MQIMSDFLLLWVAPPLCGVIFVLWTKYYLDVW